AGSEDGGRHAPHDEARKGWKSRRSRSMMGRACRARRSSAPTREATMSQAVAEHRAAAPPNVNLAVFTVSDTPTIETDTSGARIVELAEAAGHRIVARAIVPDEPEVMRPLIEEWHDRADLHALLITGGTGISARDRTFETVSALLSKPLPGFGEL